jgi:hypothetical protein
MTLGDVEALRNAFFRSVVGNAGDRSFTKFVRLDPLPESR